MRLPMTTFRSLILLFLFQTIVVMVTRNRMHTNIVNMKKIKQTKIRRGGSVILKFILTLFVLQAQTTCISNLELLIKLMLTMNEIALKHTKSSKNQPYESKRQSGQKQNLNFLPRKILQQSDDDTLLFKQLLCKKTTSHNKSKAGILSLGEFLKFHPQSKITNRNNCIYPVFLNSIGKYVTEVTSNPSLSIAEKMKYELMRLSSFKHFPETSTAFTIRLADAGFYYTGKNDRVTCFSCSVSYQDWQPGEIPIDVHRQISPNCSFINGNDDKNITVCPESITPVTTSYMACGTVNAFISNISQNIASHRHENDANSLENKVEIHHESAAEVPNVSSSASASISMLGATSDVNRSLEFSASVTDLNELGVSYDIPKYPKYAVPAVRISSYSDWPTNKLQTPRSLSSAGLFYSGIGDCVKCFFCGGGLRNWETGDDPWVEHARWFPRCTYVRQYKGDNFVQEIINASQQSMQDTSCSHDDRDIKVADPLFSPAALSVLDMGYSREEVMDAIVKLQARGDQALKAERIMEQIFNVEDRSREITVEKSNEVANGAPSDSNGTRQVTTKKELTTSGDDSSMSDDMKMSILQENIQLKEQSICKICMEERISIVFLPCRHMATCVQCAPALRRCPICRANIKGTVRAFMS